MTKNMGDAAVDSVGCCGSDKEAAGALACGHPKAKTAPVSYGMRSRTQDGDGADDDARKPSFGKGR